MLAKIALVGQCPLFATTYWQSGAGWTKTAMLDPGSLDASIGNLP